MTELSEVDGNILAGVSATTLWTLHNRATEAKRSDGVIRDPWAVTLFDAISYDYRKFGKPNQSHGLRAVAFDNEARDYLTAHPGAAVVALATHDSVDPSFSTASARPAARSGCMAAAPKPPPSSTRSASTTRLPILRRTLSVSGVA